MADFDVLVIGAGPGGYPAAIRAAQLGLRTACVEKEKLGGVCLNWGCVPSKALLKTAELVHAVQGASKMGVTVGDVSVDYAKVIARSRKVASRFEKGVKSLFKKYGVDAISGTARLTAPGQVTVTSSDGERVITAAHIVVATGARARVFDGMEVDGERVLTYREAIVGTDAPKRAIVLGAGAIGVEFAYFWNAMGVDVTVVEGKDEILPLEDAEVAAVARKQLAKGGITFQLGQMVRSAKRVGDGVEVALASGETLTADVALVALGVSPNSAGLGLEELGVKLVRGGFVDVDPSYRTSVAGVYAVGDVAARGAALAHTATRQAHVCVERIAGHHAPDVDDTAMPSCTYCQPQVASVGMTEAAAKAKGLDIKVGRFPFLANGKAQGAGHAEGLVKVILDARYGEILGAHIVGAEATEMIGELVLARQNELTADEILTTVHAHPTYTEATLEAVGDALGVSVHI